MPVNLPVKRPAEFSSTVTRAPRKVQAEPVPEAPVALGILSPHSPVIRVINQTAQRIDKCVHELLVDISTHKWGEHSLEATKLETVKNGLLKLADFFKTPDKETRDETVRFLTYLDFIVKNPTQRVLRDIEMFRDIVIPLTRKSMGSSGEELMIRGPKNELLITWIPGSNYCPKFELIADLSMYT